MRHDCFVGGTLISRYKGSVIKLLQTVYPDHYWLPWKFKCAPRDLWSSPDNYRAYFEWLRVRLGIDTLDGFYNITNTDLKKNYGKHRYTPSTQAKFTKPLPKGGGLLSASRGSLIELLSAAYPHHKFLPWKFSVVPPEWWRSQENLLMFFDWLKLELGYTKMDDFYKLTSTTFVTKFGTLLLLTQRLELAN